MLERVWALRTLGLLGLPADSREEWPSLLNAFELPGPDLGERYSLWQAAAGAIVQAGDPELAKEAIIKLGADESRYRFAYAAMPALWEVVAPVDREKSLDALLALLADDDYTLVVQEAADQALRRLTSMDAGWGARMSSSERQEAVQRWRTALAS